MNEMQMDYEIREVLHRCADGLQAPDKLKTRVDFALKSGAPAAKPRRRWGRRMIVAAAVAAIAVTGAFAAGLGSISGHSWSNQRLSLAETQAHLDEAIDAAVTLPEALGSFSFDYGNDVATTAEYMGESEDISEVVANYALDGVALHLSAHRSYTVFDGLEDTPAPQQTAEVDGVTLSFRDDTYLFVPPDYEKTEADKAAEQAGELFISYGADEAEYQQFQSVQWERDGVSYSLYGFDTGLDAQAMFALAAEVIAGQG